MTMRDWQTRLTHALLILIVVHMYLHDAGDRWWAAMLAIFWQLGICALWAIGLPLLDEKLNGKRTML